MSLPRRSFFVAMLAIVTALFAACGGRPAPSAEPGGGAPDDGPATARPAGASRAVPPAPDDPQPTAPTRPAKPIEPPPRAIAERCDANRDFDLVVGWRGLDAYEGARAIVFTTHEIARRPGDVLVATTIRGGIAAVSCRNALTEARDYPGLGVLIDLDRDGHCDPGEPLAHEQFYGWIANAFGRFEYRGQGAPTTPAPARLCALFERL